MKLELLQQVRQHILHHPERFSAAQWAWARNVRSVLQQQAVPEAFRCCIAGHVLLLSGRFDETSLLRHSVRCDDGYLGRCARDILGLSEVQRRTLFYPTQWAEPFRRDYYLAGTGRPEAEVAAAYLAHFLHTHRPEPHVPASLAPSPSFAADRPAQSLLEPQEAVVPSLPLPC